MFNAKKMLTKISKQMKEEFVYQDYSCPAVSITAGGIGTYATGANVGIEKSGYEVVSASPMLVGHSANYDVTYFIYNGKVYFSFYRVNSTAYSVPKGDIVIRVLYKKVGGGYCLKAVFSRLYAIVERRWRDAECEEGTDKTHAGYVQRCRPVKGDQSWESRRSHSHAGWLACCTGGNGQRRVNRANYPSDGWRENCRRANRHHLCWLGGVPVLRGEKGRILHHNHIQVLTNCGVAVLGSYVGGCL